VRQALAQKFQGSLKMSTYIVWTWGAHACQPFEFTDTKCVIVSTCIRASICPLAFLLRAFSLYHVALLFFLCITCA